MTTHPSRAATLTSDAHENDAVRSAAAFLAGFRSPDTRKSYRRDLACWLGVARGLRIAATGDAVNVR